MRKRRLGPIVSEIVDRPHREMRVAMNRAHVSAAATFVVALLAGACGPKNVDSAKKAEFTGPTHNQMSSSKDRIPTSAGCWLP